MDCRHEKNYHILEEAFCVAAGGFYYFSRLFLPAFGTEEFVFHCVVPTREFCWRRAMPLMPE
jgi:hypothetical protein